MKRLTLLLLFPLLLSAESWQFGGFSSYLIGHRDFAHYWVHNYGGGIDIVYPFHDQVPVSLSVHFSDHQLKSGVTPLEGHKNPERHILLMHNTLLWHYRFLPEKKIHPIVGAGLSNTLFIMYKSWPPESNDDESEYGFAFSGGLELDMGEKWKLFTDYRHSLFLTEPDIVHFSLIRFGLRFVLPERRDDA